MRSISKQLLTLLMGSITLIAQAQVPDFPGKPVRLHAQAHLQRFYGAFGFEPTSDVHLEDDIPHVWMRRL